MLKGINQLTSWIIIEPKSVTFVSKKAFSEDENLGIFKVKKILSVESLKYE